MKVICIIISIIGVYLLVAGDLSGPKLKGLGFIIMAAIVWVFSLFQFIIKPDIQMITQVFHNENLIIDEAVIIVVCFLCIIHLP